MRKELKLGPCPLSTRPCFSALKSKLQAIKYKEQLLQLFPEAKKQKSLVGITAYFIVCKGQEFPYEVHLVYRNNLPQDLLFVNKVCNSLSQL